MFSISYRSVPTRLMLLMVFLSTLTSVVQADWMYFAGYQYTCSSDFPDSGSFLDADCWLNYQAPDPGGGVILGSASLPPIGNNFAHNPHTLYFGDFCYHVSGCNPTSIPGGDVSLYALNIASGFWTFDGRRAGSCDSGEAGSLTADLLNFSPDEYFMPNEPAAMGSLTVRNIHFRANYVTLQNPAGANLTVTGSDTLLESQGIQVGYLGTGTAIVKDGAHVAVGLTLPLGSMEIGLRGVGEIALTGAGTLLESGWMDVGLSGDGSLTVSEGAHALIGVPEDFGYAALWVGGQNGHASIDVVGSGSLLLVQDAFFGNQDRSGSETRLRILGGAEMRCLSLGLYEGGHALISGLGSTLVLFSGPYGGAEYLGSLRVDGFLVEVAEGGQIVSTGTVEAFSGTLALRSAGRLVADVSFSIDNDGVLRGDGTVQTPNCYSGGRIEPETLLTMDGDCYLGGILAIQLSASPPGQCNRLSVTGDAVLYGTLNLSMVGGRPAPGTQYVVMEYGSHSGQFAGVCGHGLHYDVTYGPTSVIVTFLGPSDHAGLDDGCSVDQNDLNAFQEAFSGPGIPFTIGFGCYDLDDDGDIDQADYGVLQRCFTGPGRTVDLNCMN